MLVSGCLAHTNILWEIFDLEEWFDKIFGGNQKKNIQLLDCALYHSLIAFIPLFPMLTL